MTPPLSKELQERIERESEAYGSHPLGDFTSYKDGAIKYAHYKEKFEQAKKALEEIATSDRPTTSEEMVITLDLIYSTINSLLASWKDEGKEATYESANAW